MSFNKECVRIQINKKIIIFKSNRPLISIWKNLSIMEGGRLTKTSPVHIWKETQYILL